MTPYLGPLPWPDAEAAASCSVRSTSEVRIKLASFALLDSQPCVQT